MNWYEILFLVCGMLFALSHSKSCEEFKYGKECNSPCHCSCDDDGKCKKEFACIHGWMGAECQDENVFAASGNVLFDGNVRTCAYANDQLIVVESSRILQISWLMIDWETKAADVEITGYINGAKIKETTPFKRFAVDELRYIYHGEFETGINRINIKINKYVRVCDVKVSIGRNVALDQEVSFVGTTHESRYNDPHYVVDGVTNNGDYCLVLLAKDDEPASVTIQLSRTMSIRSWNLVSKSEYERKCGMRFFKIDSWRDGSQVFMFWHGPWTDGTFFHSLRGSYNVSRIKISQPETEDPQSVFECSYNERPTLTVCQFAIYGDSICPRGKWGKECDRKCHCKCKNKENCHPSTGYCPHGCTGFATTPCIGLTMAAAVTWFVMAFD